VTPSGDVETEVHRAPDTADTVRPRLDSDMRQLLVEVGELAARFGHEPTELPTHMAPVLGLFDRCRSTFGAVRLLLEHGFAHEAVMLGRPLFTESLMLAELADANETRRVELVVGWWMRGLADVEGIVREGQARGDDATDDLAAIATRRAELEEYARRRDARTRQWRVDEKKLAETHGRAAEYLDFDLTHHFVHGTPMAVEQRMSKIAQDTLAVGGPAADFDTWGSPSGLFAAKSLLHACRAACGIFAWDEPAALEPLMQRLDSKSEELNAAPQAEESASDDL
jgi:hypothetical protein